MVTKLTQLFKAVYRAGLFVYLLPLLFTLIEESVFSAQTRTVRVEQNEALLEYRISIAKDTFLIYEPIIAKVWLKNLSTKTIQTGFREGEGWVIRDQSGKNYRKFTHDTYLPPVRELKPGDSLGGAYGLFDYGVIQSKDGYPFWFFPEGGYRAYYAPSGSEMPLIFHVVNPKGEDAEALKLYLAAFSFVWGEVGKFSQMSEREKDLRFVEQVKKLYSVGTRYNKSVYGGVALSHANNSAMIIMHNKEIAQQMILELAQEFPDASGWAVNLLEKYYKTQRDVSTFRTELKKIIQRNANPGLTTAAKEALRKLDSKE